MTVEQQLAAEDHNEWQEKQKALAKERLATARRQVAKRRK
jgi:hypothetical protein